MIKFTVHKKKTFNTVQSHKGHMHCCSARVILTVVLTGILMAFFCNPTKLHSYILWPEWSSNHFLDTAGVAFCPQLKDTRQLWSIAGTQQKNVKRLKLLQL